MAKILVRPTKKRVIVDIFDRGEAMTKSGLIIRDDDFNERGVRPRRAKVLAIGSEVLDVNPGDIVLLSHGDWTRKFKAPFSDGESRWVWATEEERILSLVDETEV
jgi:co-chaperonin GroES (HSP10)